MNIDNIEQSRQSLQILLDSRKDQHERNKLGQYSTPKYLADSIIISTLQYLNKEDIRFLDTSIGTGVFFSSLLNNVSPKSIKYACGYEIDKHYAIPSKELWSTTKLDYVQDDFLDIEPPKEEINKYNLIISNPPYIRHHFINKNKKMKLNDIIKCKYGVSFSGLTGIYCYFIALALSWLQKDGISVWLVPNELLDVNYGVIVKQFLLKNVKLLRIHKFCPENSKFSDSLVTSIVLYYTTGITSDNVLFTTGNDLNNPNTKRGISVKTLIPNEKWSNYFIKNYVKRIYKMTLSDYFTVKRGIATGSNKYFILNSEKISKLKIPNEYIRPIIPSPRFIKNSIITAQTIKEINNYLLNITCQENTIINLPSELKLYLEKIYSDVGKNYIIKNRKPWYKQEYRSDCPFLLTYMGRNADNPFRLILNLTNATATNGYLMLYPKFDWNNIEKMNNGFLIKLYNELLAINKLDVKSFGRVYGGGLYKIEPNELTKIPLDDILSNEIKTIIQYSYTQPIQFTLFEKSKDIIIKKC